MFETSSALQFILYAFYYIVIGILAILSLFAVYILAAHGRSRMLSLITCFVYILFFLTAFGSSQATLRSIF
jgi:hypothetical protein